MEGDSDAAAFAESEKPAFLTNDGGEGAAGAGAADVSIVEDAQASSSFEDVCAVLPSSDVTDGAGGAAADEAGAAPAAAVATSASGPVAQGKARTTSALLGSLSTANLVKGLSVSVTTLKSLAATPQASSTSIGVSPARPPAARAPLPAAVTPAAAPPAVTQSADKVFAGAAARPSPAPVAHPQPSSSPGLGLGGVTTSAMSFMGFGGGSKPSLSSRLASAPAPAAGARSSPALALSKLCDMDLSSGPTHSTALVAACGGAEIAPLLAAGLAVAAWYRVYTSREPATGAVTGQRYLLLPGVRTGRYQPSVDDVGCRLLIQCRATATGRALLRSSGLRSAVSAAYGLAECAPLELDSRVPGEAEKRVTAKLARFRAQVVFSEEMEGLDSGVAVHVVLSEGSLILVTPPTPGAPPAADTALLSVAVTPTMMPWAEASVTQRVHVRYHAPAPSEEGAPVLPSRILSLDLHDGFARDVFLTVLRTWCTEGGMMEPDRLVTAAGAEWVLLDAPGEDVASDGEEEGEEAAGEEGKLAGAADASAGPGVHSLGLTAFLSGPGDSGESGGPGAAAEPVFAAAAHAEVPAGPLADGVIEQCSSSPSALRDDSLQREAQAVAWARMQADLEAADARQAVSVRTNSELEARLAAFSRERVEKEKGLVAAVGESKRAGAEAASLRSKLEAAEALLKSRAEAAEALLKSKLEAAEVVLKSRVDASDKDGKAGVSALQTKLDAAESELKSARAATKEGGAQAKQAASLAAGLKTELAAAKAAVKDAKGKEAAAKAEAESGREEAAGRGQAARTATATAEDAAKKVASLTAELVAVKDASAAELRAATEAAAAALQAAKSAHAVDADALSTARNAQAQAEATAAESSIRVSAAERAASALLTERDDLRGALQSAGASREAAEAAEVRASGLQAEVEALRARVAEVSQEVARALRAQGEAEERGQAAAKVAEQAASEAASLRQLVHGATASAARADAAEAAAAKARSELEAAVAERQAAGRKMESLRKDLARVMAGSEDMALSTVEEMMSSKKALEAKVVRLSEEAAGLREALAEAYAKVPQSGMGLATDAVAATAGATGLRPSEVRGLAADQLWAGRGGGGPPTPSTKPASFAFLSPPQPSNKGAPLVPAAALAGGDAPVVRQLQAIIADLSEQVRDKEMALENQRATKEALARRIADLEAQLEGGTPSEGE